MVMEGEWELREAVYRQSKFAYPAKCLVMSPAASDGEQSAMPLLHGLIYPTINTGHCQSPVGLLDF